MNTYYEVKSTNENYATDSYGEYETYESAKEMFDKVVGKHNFTDDYDTIDLIKWECDEYDSWDSEIIETICGYNVVQNIAEEIKVDYDLLDYWFIREESGDYEDKLNHLKNMKDFIKQVQLDDHKALLVDYYTYKSLLLDNGRCINSDEEYFKEHMDEILDKNVKFQVRLDLTDDVVGYFETYEEALDYVRENQEIDEKGGWYDGTRYRIDNNRYEYYFYNIYDVEEDEVVGRY